MSWLRSPLGAFPAKSTDGQRIPVEVDVVVVQGHPSERDAPDTTPLEQLLPEVADQTRTIFAYRGYSIAGLFAASPADIVDWAFHYLTSLLELRRSENEAQRPIIFVGYSFGGILLKQLLLQARTQKRFISIFENVIGVIFLGTPHRGTELEEYGNILSKVADVLDSRPFGIGNRLFDALSLNGDILQQLTPEFKTLYTGPVLSFYGTESEPTVPEKQITLLGLSREKHIAVKTNREGLFQFSDKNDPVLQLISEEIKSLFKRTGHVPPSVTEIPRPVLPLKCPACRELSPDSVPSGIESPVLNYSASLDPLHRKAMGLWVHRCVLANFVSQNTTTWAKDSLEISSVPERLLASEYTCSPAWDTSRRLDLSIEHDHFSASNFQNIVVHEDPISAQSVAQVKHWIRKCQRSHPECGLEWTPLPSRVLDVSDPNSIKLVRPLGLEDKYVALSHCWGASNSFVTTKQNIKSIKSGFNIRAVPKTFRDAILVTRQLGIRYLWIDSLCIVQGDSTDWETEVGKMADIFANAHITISAANAPADSDGFLRQRNTSYLPVVISAGRDRSTTAYLYQKTYWHDRNEEPLDRRAWAFQEQYVSRRNVRYCGKEMSWRCKMAEWSESGPPNDRLRDWEKPWTEMVEEFSRRKLTYETDRLSAIAGAASAVAHLNGEEYCAGLWLQNMPEELLFERKAALMPPEYTAPSWSWAALGGPVTFIAPRTEGFCRLKQVKVSGFDVRTSSANRFGPLKKRGWLKLKAPFIHLRRKPGAMAAGTISPFEIAGPPCQKIGARVIANCKFDSSDLDELEEVHGLVLGYSAPVITPGATGPQQHNPAVWSDETLASRATSFQAQSQCDGLYGILIAESEEDSPQRRTLSTKIFGKSKDSSRTQFQRCGFFEILGLKDDQGPQILASHSQESIVLH